MNVLRRPTKEFCDIDQKFDVEFDQLEVLAEKAAEAQREAERGTAQLIGTRSACRTLAKSFDEAMAELNEGVREIHQLVASTAAATGALSCGTGNRLDNEVTYLKNVSRFWR